MLLSVRVLLTFAAFAAAVVSPAHAENSKLWGRDGESWDPAGPLPDFSFAGYRRGESPIPDRPADVSVRDFGAVGDGKTDDTTAIQKAIDASAGKVIGIPEGRYLVTGILEIKSSGTVLRGAGPEKTILVCPKPLEEIRPKPLKGQAAKTEYSWSGGIVRIAAPPFGYRNLTNIVPGARRGDSAIAVTDTRDLTVGQEVLVTLTDDESHSLLNYLYAGDPGDLSKFRDRTSFRQPCRIQKIDGKNVTLDRALRYDIRSEWTPKLRRFDTQVREAGIERIGFEFPDSDYGGHFTETGFNAIEFESVADCWAQDIRIVNADSGIFLDRCTFCTVRRVVIESGRKPDARNDCTGHHGIQIMGEDNLTTDFEFRTKFIHDLTVQHSIGNVFSSGRGVDLSLDHHRHAPHENLFSKIDLGKGTRVFYSGGSQGVGQHSAAGTTFWNLASKDYQEWPGDFGPDRMNWIGLKTRERKSEDREGRWIEPIRPGAVEPEELHAAQLEKRLAAQLEKRLAARLP